MKATRAAYCIKIPKSSQALAVMRVSYASLMMHALYWMLDKNIERHTQAQYRANCRTHCRYFVAVRACARLLGVPGKDEIEFLQRNGIYEVTVAADTLLAAETRYRMSSRIARAPVGFSLKKTPAEDPVVLARMIMVPNVHASSSGGFNIGRSPSTALWERSMRLLGALSDRHRTRLQHEWDERSEFGLYEMIGAIIEKNRLGEPMKEPDFMEKDEDFRRWTESIRWMNFMDPDCNRG